MCREQQKELEGLLERDVSELTCRHLREHDIACSIARLKIALGCPCAVTALPVGPDGLVSLQIIYAELPLGAVRAERDRLAVVVEVGPPAGRVRFALAAAHVPRPR